MNKWLKRLSPISMPPTDRKELIPWLLFKLLYWLVGPFLLLAVIGGFLLVTFFAFMIGDYNGSPQGTYHASTSTVVLTKKQQALNNNTNYNATKVADTWETGLTTSEVQAVDQANLEVPTSLLLALGKTVDNLKNNTIATFQKYYRYLSPIDFSFIHKTDTTITYSNEWFPPVTTCKPSHRKGKPQCNTTPGYWACVVNPTYTPVTLITYANTWNGTYSAKYQDVVTGTKGCGPHGSTNTWSSTWTAIPGDTKRVYSWAKIWNLFKHIKTVTGWYVKDSYDQDFIAGFMAVSDPTIDDPYVQNMVTQLEFMNGAVSALVGISNNPTPASPNIIANVLSYTNAIIQLAGDYQIPPALVGGVMAAESHGEQTDFLGLTTPTTITQSVTGALGLMQVEPTTAQGLTIVMPNGSLQKVGNAWYSLLSNPITNISIGTDYLGNLYKEFNSNMTEVFAAYNAGPQAEKDALVGINAITINGTPIPNIQQTIDYVERIEEVYLPALQGGLGTINGTNVPSVNASPSNGGTGGATSTSGSGNNSSTSGTKKISVLESSAVNGQITLRFGGTLTHPPTVSEFTVYEIVDNAPKKVTSIQLSAVGSHVALTIPKVPATTKDQEVTVIVQYAGATQYDNTLTFRVPAS